MKKSTNSYGLSSLEKTSKATSVHICDKIPVDESKMLKNINRSMLNHSLITRYYYNIAHLFEVFSVSKFTGIKHKRSNKPIIKLCVLIGHPRLNNKQC